MQRSIENLHIKGQDNLFLGGFAPLYPKGMTELSALAVYVRFARKHKGLSQQALGDILGVTKGNISAWENGRHEPSVSQLKRISTVTDTAIPHEVIGQNAESVVSTRYKLADPSTRALIDIALASPSDPLPDGLSPSLRILVDMARAAIRAEQEKK